MWVFVVFDFVMRIVRKDRKTGKAASERTTQNRYVEEPRRTIRKFSTILAKGPSSRGSSTGGTYFPRSKIALNTKYGFVVIENL